jgi:hypothetical protein
MSQYSEFSHDVEAFRVAMLSHDRASIIMPLRKWAIEQTPVNDARDWDERIEYAEQLIAYVLDGTPLA